MTATKITAPSNLPWYGIANDTHRAIHACIDHRVRDLVWFDVLRRINDQVGVSWITHPQKVREKVSGFSTKHVSE
jgi:hypothetical protein